MITTIQRVSEAVCRSIDEINRQLPDDQKLADNGTSAILGPNATLDSLGFLNLLVAVEREVETEFGTELRLTEDETIMHDSPVETVDALIRYIAGNLEVGKE